MSRTVRIMLPHFKESSKETIYLKGHLNTSEPTEIVIYLTEHLNNADIFREHEQNDVIYGCWCPPRARFKYRAKSKHFVYLEKSNCLRIRQLQIDRQILNVNNCIIMFYDYNTFRKSESVNDNNHLQKIQSMINTDYCKPSDTCAKNVKCPYWLSASMFFQHVINYINLYFWLTSTLKREKKVTVKLGNLIFAVLADITIGYLILSLMVHETDLNHILMGLLEKLVNLLYSLLKWLMGAPAGLKLNNAFNKMLGQYFSYHIQLWWLFLDVSGEKLGIILDIYRYVGYLGFTFQAAMISDLICIVTFHSYCIYVYAARLFNLQISGLVALLRLFVGRKFNPLRGGIDSCEYTNQELFVGTVAFTILLLLLPTTTMYYTVFTLFRLLSLLVQYTLAKLIFVVQTLPLYLTTLWLANSPKVAGNVLIEMVNNEDESTLVLNVKLLSKSLGELIEIFKPPVYTPKKFDWANVLSNIVAGKQFD